MTNAMAHTVVDPVDRNAASPEVIIWTASEALPVRAKTQPRINIPFAFQIQGAFFVRQSDEFIRIVRLLPRNSRRKYESNDASWQRVHQRSGVVDLARIPERVFDVCERGLGIAKHPQGQRPIAKIATPMSWPNRVASGRCSAGS